MNGRIAKQLRKFFFGGANGSTARNAKSYMDVEHDSSLGRKPRGGFKVLDLQGPHRRYRVGKSVYMESNGVTRRRMMVELEEAIIQGQRARALPPSAEPGRMVQG